MTLGHLGQLAASQCMTANQHISDLIPEIGCILQSCVLYVLHRVSRYLLPTISVLSVAVKHITKQNNDTWMLNQSKQHVQNNLSTMHN